VTSDLRLTAEGRLKWGSARSSLLLIPASLKNTPHSAGLSEEQQAVPAVLLVPTQSANTVPTQSANTVPTQCQHSASTVGQHSANTVPTQCQHSANTVGQHREHTSGFHKIEPISPAAASPVFTHSTNYLRAEQYLRACPLVLPYRYPHSFFLFNW
jgi:hypothetical protein